MSKAKSTRELVEDAVKRARNDREHFKSVGEEFQKEFGDHEGPLFGPRDDIERRKRLKEIQESGKDDE